MTGTGVGVKCSGFTEHLVLVQCVLETWWDCTTHEEEDGLGVLELTVQRLLVQGTPPLLMDSSHLSTGTGAGVKCLKSMQEAREVVLLSMQKMI